ncbi:hypothetical protein DE146DRAFT_751480 [Phaeosphaeria sp. MPI-PUGE-AT-0046c]|nr:hypothetical protein DE146DRAFT_751480 [Phaeosphaeria sp. MPI-PUGE-AT-0046c]
MRLTLLTLGLATSSVLAQATVEPLNVPDGAYTVLRFENGTHVYTPTDGSDPITITREQNQARQAKDRRSMLSSPALSKRRTDCWGWQLHNREVDDALAGLENYAKDVPMMCSGVRGATTYTSVIFGSTMAYWCINESSRCSYLNRNDVIYAKGQMDAVCRAYEASWFGWPRSFEIVGKALASSDVCMGGMNGKPF